MPKVMVKVEVDTGDSYTREVVVGVERGNEIPGLSTSLRALTEDDIVLADRAVIDALDAAREEALLQLERQRQIVRARQPQGGPSRDHVPADVAEGF